MPLVLALLFAPAQASELVSDPWIVGETIDIAITSAPASTVFAVVASASGPTANGPCPAPLQGSCFDVASPKVLGTGTTDGNGDATVAFTVPAGALGRTLYLQAAFRAQPNDNTPIVEVEGCADADGDGHCTLTDCDDNDATVFPGQIERCHDGVDNDCDAATGDLYDLQAPTCQLPLSLPDLAAFTLTSAEVVPCDLTDGSQALCHELVFAGTNPVDDGPYCPETIDDVGGIGIYEGMDPPFQVLAEPLWLEMEADGYDIVDPNGNINVLVTGAPQGDSCLEQLPADLEMVYRIPAEPVEQPQSTPIGSVEFFAAQLDGIPMNGDPPAVVGGGPAGPGGQAPNLALLPALDPCGGHLDPAGYYHAHFVAESISTVFDAFSITAVTCDRVPQTTTALIGFAKDGFPVYAAHDATTGAVPDGLDECNGRFGPTAEFPEGTYHYFALETEAPNVPGCLRGLATTVPFEVR